MLKTIRKHGITLARLTAFTTARGVIVAPVN